MTAQKEKAELFHRLHLKGDPLILFNIWDAGSAKAVEAAGAKAIATGSWAVAAANGFTDGENVPLGLALGNLERIVATTDLPVTLDLEGGYATDTAELERNIENVIKAGAIGINFEDQIVAGDGLHSVEDQCDRIRAIRRAADRLSIPLFINARTDVFLKTYPEKHDRAQLEEAVKRASEYAKAGASGFFAPGLRDPEYIRELCGVLTIPVNILVFPDTPPPRELAELGVARISYGAGPYRQVMESLKAAGQRAISYRE